MSVWQADFYRRPLQDTQGNLLWELVICDVLRQLEVAICCPQSQATAAWVTEQLKQLVQQQGRPERIQVFRPQSLSLLELAGQTLGITVEPTRQTTALKHLLQERAQLYPTLPGYTQQPYQPTDLEKPPPLPLPEQLWGDRWRFATLPAGNLVEAFQDLPIPIKDIPEALIPLKLGLASNVPVPGVVIDGGRQSLRIARWIQSVQPVSLGFILGAPDGLVLEAGLIDRWVVATFEDAEVRQAAQLYEQRQQLSRGLHFLLVQPDDSGITYSGFWLLRSELAQ